MDSRASGRIMPPEWRDSGKMSRDEAASMLDQFPREPQFCTVRRHLQYSGSRFTSSWEASCSSTVAQFKRTVHRGRWAISPRASSHSAWGAGISPPLESNIHGDQLVVLPSVNGEIAGRNPDHDLLARMQERYILRMCAGFCPQGALRGTIFMMDSPGVATPPAVLIWRCFIVSRTGDRSSVRVTRLLPEEWLSRREESSMLRLLISSMRAVSSCNGYL